MLTTVLLLYNEDNVQLLFTSTTSHGSSLNTNKNLSKQSGKHEAGCVVKSGVLAMIGDFRVVIDRKRITKENED